MNDTIAFLKTIPLFKPLSDASYAVIANLSEPIQFTKAEAIISEDSQSGHVFILVDGEAEVWKRGLLHKSPSTESLVTESTQERLHKDEDMLKLVTLRKGDIVGIGSLFLENTPHSASVIASTDSVRALRINNELFQKAIKEHGDIALALLKDSVKEVRTFRSKDIVLSDLVNNHDERFKVVFFDFKPYEKPYFNQELSKIKDLNCHFFKEKLSMETVNLAAGAKVICIFVNDIASDAQIISHLHSIGVEMIALRCAGFNNVDLKACDALGVSVARVPAYSPYSVAEHACALLLAINRKLPTAYSRNKSGNFALSGLVGFDLHGKTIGVIGTGKIGVCFIKIMLGFGCNVLAYDVYPSEEVAAMKGVKYVALPDLLAQSDVISIHCPLLPSTQFMINNDTISQMKKGVILINTSRGGLIKTIDLIKGLKSGQIGGAGLDVYEDEREYFFEDRSHEVMKDDVLARLMTFNNVLITAHQAFLTEEALAAIARTTAGNIQEFIQGKTMKKLTNSVNGV